MGEAKRKLRDHAAILAGNPGCIYCAGENIATAIEHMPPISVFEGRQRPKGLEFPACQPCNNGTGHSDLVAAMLSRAWPNPFTDAQKGDAKRIFNAVANNLPDVLWEISQASMHGGADYTPYEGLAVVGWPLSVILRGQFVVREGTVVGKKQAGAHVKRAKKFRQAL